MAASCLHKIRLMPRKKKLNKFLRSATYPTKYHNKTCNKCPLPPCPSHALPLQNMKWTYMQKFHYHVIILMLALNKISPSDVTATSGCVYISHFGVAKREMYTLVQHLLSLC